jgi:3',5'-cyclic AMP phosphodiesterase CpdA
MGLKNEIPLFMFVAFVYGLCFFFWVLGKWGISPETDQQYGIRPATTLLIGGTVSCLGLLLAVPGWMAGLPPEPSAWYYVIQMTLILASMSVSGVFFYAALMDRDRRMAALTGSLHLLLCVTIFLVPLAETHSEAHSVYESMRVVEPLSADCNVSGSTLFVDLSDVHLVSSPDEPPATPTKKKVTMDGTLAGDDFIAPVLDWAKHFKPRYVFVTGDVTDTGSKGQWENALRKFKNISELSEVMMVPGNHDQNLAFISTKYTVDEALNLHDVSVFDSKMASFFKVQSRLFPGVRAATGETVDQIVAGAPPVIDPRDWMKAAKFFNDKVEICTQNNASDKIAVVRVQCELGVRKYFPEQIKPLSTVEQGDQYWDARKRSSFPLYFHDPEFRASIFLLGSALSDTESIGANAIGEFDEIQIRNLRMEIKSAPKDTRYFFFLLHHPLTRPVEERFILPAAKGLVLQSLTDSNWWAYAFLRENVSSANKVLGAISYELRSFPAAAGYVMFGHRHRRSLGTWAGLTFIEAPNVAAVPPNRGLYVGSLVNDRLSVHWCEAK